MIYGYARVSTDKQDTDAQRRALEAAGCETIIEEQASGRRARPALSRLLDQLQEGDTLTVWKVNRLARSVADFYRVTEAITAKGAELRSLSESFDTSTPIADPQHSQRQPSYEAELYPQGSTQRERCSIITRAAIRAFQELSGKRPIIEAEEQAVPDMASRAARQIEEYSIVETDLIEREGHNLYRFHLNVSGQIVAEVEREAEGLTLGQTVQLTDAMLAFGDGPDRA